MAIAPPVAAQPMDPAVRLVSVDWGDAPPGYDEPLPATRADWEAMRRVLGARVLRAERQLDKVQRERDDAEFERVEDEFDARRDALKAFEERTMQRMPELWIPGVTLAGAGTVGLLWFALSNLGTTGESPGVEVPAAGVAGLIGVAGGLPLLLIGARKTWRGPSDDAEASVVGVGVGPGSISLRGAF
ncbi:MAG: hypothetical protein WKG00_10540 [Polyangiaceae bacterium]